MTRNNRTEVIQTMAHALCANRLSVLHPSLSTITASPSASRTDASAVNQQSVGELRPEEELLLRGRPVLHVRGVRVESEADDVVEGDAVPRRQEVEVEKLQSDYMAFQVTYEFSRY